MVQPESDIVVLWKSLSIKLPNDNIMIILYYYYTNRDNKKKNFYKCSFRIDTKENWINLKNNLIKTNPAEEFKMSMIDMEDNYRLFYTNRVFNRMDMSRWIGSKISSNKIISLNEFINNHLNNITVPYIRKYVINNSEIDITDIDNIPNGLWFSAYKEKKPRKKYGNLIY